MEDIRCAEKDVMDVQERLLKASNQLKNQIELKPWNIENYSLLNQGILNDNNVDRIKESERIIIEFVHYFLWFYVNSM